MRYLLILVEDDHRAIAQDIDGDDVFNINLEVIEDIPDCDHVVVQRLVQEVLQNTNIDLIPVQRWSNGIWTPPKMSGRPRTRAWASNPIPIRIRPPICTRPLAGAKWPRPVLGPQAL